MSNTDPSYAPIFTTFYFHQSCGFTDLCKNWLLVKFKCFTLYHLCWVVNCGLANSVIYNDNSTYRAQERAGIALLIIACILLVSGIVCCVIMCQKANEAVRQSGQVRIKPIHLQTQRRYFSFGLVSTFDIRSCWNHCALNIVTIQPFHNVNQLNDHFIISIVVTSQTGL